MSEMLDLSVNKFTRLTMALIDFQFLDLSDIATQSASLLIGQSKTSWKEWRRKMKTFDLTNHIGQQNSVHTIWGMAQISVSAPATKRNLEKIIMDYYPELATFHTRQRRKYNRRRFSKIVTNLMFCSSCHGHSGC